MSERLIASGIASLLVFQQKPNILLHRCGKLIAFFLQHKDIGEPLLPLRNNYADAGLTSVPPLAYEPTACSPEKEGNASRGQAGCEFSISPRAEENLENEDMPSHEDFWGTDPRTELDSILPDYADPDGFCSGLPPITA